MHVACWLNGERCSLNVAPSLHTGPAHCSPSIQQDAADCSASSCQSLNGSSAFVSLAMGERGREAGAAKDTDCIMALHVVQVLAAGACNRADPGPGCPCKLEELAPSGACPAGYQCAPQSQLGRTIGDGAQGDAAAAGVCVPCSLGQYCPRGAVLPLPGSPEASQYVARYACRSAIPMLSNFPLTASPQLGARFPHILLPAAEMQGMR